MKTIDIGPDGMDAHTVRFRALQPKKGNYESLGIPTEAYEMLTAKTLYTLLAPADAAGSHQFTAAKGPPGLSISIAECPPGDGPDVARPYGDPRNFLLPDRQVRGQLGGRWRASPGARTA